MEITQIANDYINDFWVIENNMYSQLLIVLGACLIILLFYKIAAIVLVNLKINEEYKKKIRYAIFRTGLFLVFSIQLVIIIFSWYYESTKQQQEWIKNNSNYIICMCKREMRRLESNDNSGKIYCSSKRMVAPYPSIYDHLYYVIVLGGITLSVSCSNETLETFKSLFYRCCAPAENNSNSVKKHKLITKAIQKRHEINKGEDINFCNEDPLDSDISLSTSYEERDQERRQTLDSFLGFNGNSEFLNASPKYIQLIQHLEINHPFTHGMTNVSNILHSINSSNLRLNRRYLMLSSNNYYNMPLSPMSDSSREQEYFPISSDDEVSEADSENTITN